MCVLPLARCWRSCHANFKAHLSVVHVALFRGLALDRNTGPALRNWSPDLASVPLACALQVPAASSLHVESSAASGSTHLDCASWEDDSCTRKLAAVSSLPGEASTASRSEHSAPACWEDDSICSGRSDSGACGSLSSVGSSSGGSGEPHCAPCASRSTQEAEPMPAKACSGFPPLPELPDSACSAQLHSSARTCQVSSNTSTCGTGMRPACKMPPP